MRRLCLAMATAMVAVTIVSGTALANHECRLRVSSVDRDAASATSTAAAAGETVTFHLYGFDPGTATLEWTLNGVRVKAKDRIVTVRGDGDVVRITLDDSDVGTVVVQPRQPAGYLSGSCGQLTSSHPLHPYTIIVSPRLPETDTELSATQQDPARPTLLLAAFVLLAGASALTTLLHRRPRRRASRRA